MARNLKFFYDDEGAPCARGPQSEKLLMTFLETDIQGDDHICHDLMEDLDAVSSGAAEQREFIGNAHSVLIVPDGITIESTILDDEADEPINKLAENSAGEKEASVEDEKSAEVDTTKKDNVGVEGNTPAEYKTSIRHFRQIVEDWEAFILDEADNLPDSDNMPV